MSDNKIFGMFLHFFWTESSQAKQGQEQALQEKVISGQSLKLYSLLDRARNGNEFLIACIVNLVIYFFVFCLEKYFGGMLFLE